MNRKVVFSNTALNCKKLKKIGDLLDNNHEVDKLIIYSVRNIKENHIKIHDSQTFNSIQELMDYINENNIKTLESLEFNIYYKNKNKATLNYEAFDYRWELSFYNQDNNTDSLIFNIKPLLRNNPMKFFRQHRNLVLSFICGLWFMLVLVLGKAPNIYISMIFNTIYILLFIDIFFIKNVAFREYKFISRNKDNFIFYFLGVITPYIINFIIELLKKLF